MNAASILTGLAFLLGAFAIVVIFIWLIFRGVEHEISLGRQSNFFSMSVLTFFAVLNAILHFSDADGWRYFYIVAALFGIFVTWREWRKESV